MKFQLGENLIRYGVSKYTDKQHKCYVDKTQTFWNARHSAARWLKDTSPICNQMGFNMLVYQYEFCVSSRDYIG